LGKGNSSIKVNSTRTQDAEGAQVKGQKSEEERGNGEMGKEKTEEAR